MIDSKYAFALGKLTTLPAEDAGSTLVGSTSTPLSPSLSPGASAAQREELSVGKEQPGQETEESAARWEHLPVERWPVPTPLQPNTPEPPKQSEAQGAH